MLRAGDSVPGSRTVYRITVRQLEALIRLSEALARVQHRVQVLVEDVNEAQRLIKASVHSAGDGDMVMDIPEATEGTEDIARLFLNDDAQADADMEDQAGACRQLASATWRWIGMWHSATCTNQERCGIRSTRGFTEYCVTTCR